MTDNHSEVQDKLENFYWRMNEQENHHQKVAARCAQLEAVSIIMKGICLLIVAFF